jgi:hypothetical protein
VPQGDRRWPVQNGADVGADGWVGGCGVFADDDDGSQGSKALHELLDAGVGGVVQVTVHRQGREWDGQVGLHALERAGSITRASTIFMNASSPGR